jgi:tetratricopeptide (TPR) repeat protein
MGKAMQLKTPEAAFYYHAGLIDNALGKKEEAREMLKRALELNPHFDARQAFLAGVALKELS